MASNDGFIEFLSPGALEELEKANKLIAQMVIDIDKINSKNASTKPSVVSSDIEALNKAYSQQAKEIDNLQKKIQSLTETRAKNRTLTSQEKVDNQILLQQEKQKLIMTSKLAGEYQKLNTARTQAKNALRDLIASEKASNAEIRKAQREFDILDKKVRKADKAVGDMSKNVGNYKSAFSGFNNLMGAFGVATGLYLAADITKQIYQTTKQLQSLNLALRMVSDTQEEFNSNQSFISGVAVKWGVEIKGLTEQYTKFYTASKGILSTSEIKQTFESIAKSGALMGLSIEKQNDTFLALEQMMSKGKVTAEELTRQLGNAMPGAIRAAAMAYMELHPNIKTIQEAERELYKEMKKGAIDSATYVPLIVKNFEKLYNIENVEKVDTLAASQNRLANSWTAMIDAMADSDTSGVALFFKEITNGLKNIIDLVGMLFKDEGQLQSYFKKLGATDAAQYIKEVRKNNEGVSKEQQIRLEDEILDRQRENVKNQEKIIRLEKEKRKSLTGGDRALFHLQTKKEEDALVSLGKSLEIIKQIKSEGLFPEKKARKPIPTGGGKQKTETIIALSDEIQKNDYDAKIAQLKKEQQLLDDIAKNEKNSYEVRLQARVDFSRKTQELLDYEYRKAVANAEEKNKQALKDEEDAKTKQLATNAKNVSKGFEDKSTQIIKRYNDNKATLEYNLAQEKLKINENYYKGVNDLANDDYKFTEHICDEKIKLERETAEIYFEITQNARKKEAEDDQNSLLKRQSYFDAWKQQALMMAKANYELNKAETNQSPEQLAKVAAEYERITNAIKNAVSPMEQFARETKTWIESFQNDFASKTGFEKTFAFLKDDFFKNINEAFDKGLLTSEERFAAYFNAISEMAQEAFNFISEMSNKRFEDEKKRLEDEYNLAVSYAGDSKEAKEKLEKDYEKRKNEIANRENRAKKQQAIFNIAIDTAQAIVGAWVKPGFPAAIPLVAMLAGLGALQIGMVSAQKVPQYWKGTDNADGGLAWTQEKGQEVITDKYGNIKDLGDNKGARLTMLSKGDKVFTAEKTKKMLFDDNLNAILTNNGINTPTVVVNQGLTKEDMQSIMQQTLGGMPKQVINFDKKGFGAYINKNGNITRSAENRGNANGLIF